jgi:sugar/nucleoside kinase (ribokinase family)
MLAGRDWTTCLRMGNAAAGEVISHVGARPEADLRALFAAGFLHGLTTGRDRLTAARMGCLAAGEVISHVGARPEADLRALFADAGLN